MEQKKERDRNKLLIENQKIVKNISPMKQLGTYKQSFPFPTKN